MAEIIYDKWSDPSVPKRGWECIEVEDLGREHKSICEMCNTAIIRYVHHMTHPKYPDELEVGCICAGNMEGDETAAKKREKDFKSTARRRATFLQSKRWHLSEKGNSVLKYQGYTAVITKRTGQPVVVWSENNIPRTVCATGYGIVVYHREAKRTSPRQFKDQDKAKLAAFNLIKEWASEKKKPGH